MTDQHAVLLEVVSLFRNAPTLEDVWRHLPTLLAREFDFPMAGIELFEPASGTMRMVGSCGLPPEFDAGRRVPLAETLSGEVATTGRALVTLDAGARPEDGARGLRAAGATTFVCVPVTAGGQVLATLGLADPARRAEARGVLGPLQVVADHLALELRRKRAEEELARSEARFRALIEHGTDGLMLADAPGIIRWASATAGRILGASPDTLPGTPWSAFVPPDVRPRAEHGWAVMLAHPGLPVTATGSISRADGSSGWVESTICNLLEHPAVAAVVVNFRDVTERVLADERRRLLEAATGQSSEGVAIADLDGRIRYVNDAWADMHGWDADQAVGRPLAAFHTPEQLVRDVEPFLERVRREGRHQGAVGHLHRDGREVPTWMSCTLVRDQADQPLALLGVAVDVSERRRMAQALDDQQQRHRALLDASPDLMFLQARDGTYLDYHAARPEDLLVPPERFLGKTSHEVFPKDLADVLQACVERAAATGELQVAEYQVPLGNVQRHFEARVVPCGPDRVLTIVRDNTERRTAEEERARLEAHAAQTRRMEVIGNLAGGVAHDFNNILSVVLTCSGLALKGLPDGHPVRRELEEIRSAGQRAAALTRQLLAFGRRQAAEPRTFFPNEVVAALARMLGRLIGEHIRIELQLDVAAPAVHMDPAHLEQVLLNLAVNARDAMPDGGTLVIAVGPRHLASGELPGGLDVPPGDYVQFTVTDTGSGMAPEVQARLFEPFFTTKPAGKGTGLGLAVVYGIVKQNGGHVDVLSAQGRGTTFTVWFPAVQAPKPVAPEAEDVGRWRGKGELVVVVEDDVTVRTVLSRLLETHGYRVLTADDGEAALAGIERGELPALVITDAVMPGMSGPALARRLRQRRPDLPVVLCTGYTDDLLARPDVRQDVAAVLHKPVDAAELLRCLREVLGRRRQAP